MTSSPCSSIVSILGWSSSSCDREPRFQQAVSLFSMPVSLKVIDEMEPSWIFLALGISKPLSSALLRAGPRLFTELRRAPFAYLALCLRDSFPQGLHLLGQPSEQVLVQKGLPYPSLRALCCVLPEKCCLPLLFLCRPSWLCNRISKARSGCARQNPNDPCTPMPGSGRGTFESGVGERSTLHRQSRTGPLLAESLTIWRKRYSAGF